jgi:hypothetical protein
MDLLCIVSKADTAGRPPLDPTGSFPQIEEFEQARKSLDIPIGGPKPLVGGDFLIKLGVTPGPIFKEILGGMYEHQLDGTLNDEGTAQWWISYQVAWRKNAGLL